MPYKLLIVDDEKEIRNGMACYFPWESVGFEVAYTSENGETALEILREHAIDAVLTDISMPRMDGLTLIKTLRQTNRNVKIIILSVHRQFDYAQTALSLGVYGYLVKPTKYQDLMALFSRLKEDLDRENNALPPGAALPAGTYALKRIEAIKAYIAKHVATVTLEDVARSVNMNPYYVSSFFKAQTGERFSDYVIRIKMETAERLLMNPENRISEISDQVGYRNANNFSRTFRQYSGYSPREYRFYKLQEKE